VVNGVHWGRELAAIVERGVASLDWVCDVFELDQREREIVERSVFPYRWRVRTRLPERFGERCRVLVRGGRNSCVVEFPDGYRVVTSRWYVRRAA
jgi:hypothetical protein